jgi:hypothetical protein
LLVGDTHGLQLATGMRMKPEFIFLSMIVPGPNSLGQNIDVYHRPLIDKLKQL